MIGKMKKLLLVLLFVPLVSFGQTINDAMDFIQRNYGSWACEEYTKGTFEKRLTFSLENDNKTLLIKQVGTQDNRYVIYYFYKINLSKITRIYSELNYKGCAGIYIQTRPYGMDGFAKKNTGEILLENTAFNEIISGRNWMNEEMRIINDEYFDERSKRLIKALKFLATANGAELKDSYF
tara:strand:+ start:476 stop:1015 length:540 start_codon:yes stop_codon:yes gene_type:complete